MSKSKTYTFLNIYEKDFHIISNKEINLIFWHLPVVDVVVDLTNTYISGTLFGKKKYRQINLFNNPSFFKQILSVVDYDDYCLYRALNDKKKFNNESKFIEYLKNIYIKFDFYKSFTRVFGRKFIFAIDSYIDMNERMGIIRAISDCIYESEIDKMYYDLSKKYNQIMIII